MKNLNILLTVIIIFAKTCVCNGGERIIRFRGIAPDDKNGLQGLYNPERGFRLETAVDLVINKDNPTLQLDTLAAKYASDSISLSQSYFYLTFLTGKRLSDSDFQTMQRYFDRLQQLGKKAVLRFAYEKDFMNRAPIGPTLEEALAHLDQLKPFLYRNKDLILVVQAGVIGAWGEWHSSIHRLENSDKAKIAILEKLLEIVPQEKDIQVRLPEFKNLLKNKPELYKRLSFHDDFIVIKPDRWDGSMHEGTENFKQIVNESPYLTVDGELPWGFWSVGNDPDSPSTGWIINGLAVARRLFLQHYTSLSIIHNYKEQHSNYVFDEAHAPEYSMVVWKKSLISADSLQKYHMPVSDHYFNKKDGTKIPRNIFDYIRDHLGYRIELQSLTIPQTIASNQTLKFELKYINRGFASFRSDRPAYFVLIDSSGRVTELAAKFDAKDSQPYRPGDTNHAPLVHSITLSQTISIAPGDYYLGLWMPDASDRLKYNSRYAVRCANGNMEWWHSANGRYSVNVLTKIHVEP